MTGAFMYKQRILAEFFTVLLIQNTVTVEINKLGWLEQFDITSTSFFFYFNTFERK